MMDQFQALGLMVIVGILLSLVWVVTLIQQAKDADWIWFVITLVLPIALIFYWIVRLVKK